MVMWGEDFDGTGPAAVGAVRIVPGSANFDELVDALVRKHAYWRGRPTSESLPDFFRGAFEAPIGRCYECGVLKSRIQLATGGGLGQEVCPLQACPTHRYHYKDDGILAAWDGDAWVVNPDPRR